MLREGEARGSDPPRVITQPPSEGLIIEDALDGPRHLPDVSALKQEARLTVLQNLRYSIQTTSSSPLQIWGVKLTFFLAWRGYSAGHYTLCNLLFVCL